MYDVEKDQEESKTLIHMVHICFVLSLVWIAASIHKEAMEYRNSFTKTT